MTTPREELDEAVAHFTDPALRALLTERLRQAVELELERAGGADVTLGEQALKASIASIAYEHQVWLELKAARLALKVLFRLIGP
jgi:hypothetical protein